MGGFHVGHDPDAHSMIASSSNTELDLTGLVVHGGEIEMRNFRLGYRGTAGFRQKTWKGAVEPSRSPIIDSPPSDSLTIGNS
jgi:hypothetical protein